MSVNEGSTNKLETGTERPAPRAKRPPPPPPTVHESFPTIEVRTVPNESIYFAYSLFFSLSLIIAEITPPPSETSNESIKDLEDKRPQLL